MFYVDFCVCVLSTCLNGRRRAFGHKDTLWKAEGLKGGGFRASTCAQWKRKSKQGTWHKYEALRRKIWASQVHCVLKGKNEGGGNTPEGWRWRLQIFEVCSCTREVLEGAWHKFEGWRRNLCAFEVGLGAQSVKRAHGALWKDEEWSLRPLVCTNELKEGSFLRFKRVRSKEDLVSQRV